MDKQKLEQYRFISDEIAHLKRTMARCEDDIAKLIEEGTVKDRVYGGEGGIQGFNIEGFPEGLYNRKLRVLRRRKLKLLEKETQLVELAEELDEYFAQIKNIRDRMIIRMVYVDGMTQEEVGKRMHCDRSLVSKIISKYV